MWPLILWLVVTLAMAESVSRDSVRSGRQLLLLLCAVHSALIGYATWPIDQISVLLLVLSMIPAVAGYALGRRAAGPGI